MKKLYTLLAGSLLMASAFANDITISVASDKYDVYVDGRKISDYNRSYQNNTSKQNTFTLSNIAPGYHKLEVVKDKNSNGNDNRDWKNRNNKENIFYSSGIDVRAGYDLFVEVDKKGRVQVDERRDRNYNDRNSQDRRDRNYNDRNSRDRRDRDYDRRDRDNGGYNNGSYDNNRGNNNGGYNNGGYNNGGYNTNRAMDDNSFNQLVQSIRNKWLGKLNAARDAVTQNYLSTYQVRQILEIFSSENDKLDLAKLAYRNAVDQRSYSQLYPLFSTQGQAELDTYIRNFRY